MKVAHCINSIVRGRGLKKILLQDVGVCKQDSRLVQEFILEGRDGVDFSWPSELRENHLRQRYSCKLKVCEFNKLVISK